MIDDDLACESADERSLCRKRRSGVTSTRFIIIHHHCDRSACESPEANDCTSAPGSEKELILSKLGSKMTRKLLNLAQKSIGFPRIGSGGIGKRARCGVVYYMSGTASKRISMVYPPLISANTLISLLLTRDSTRIIATECNERLLSLAPSLGGITHRHALFSLRSPTNEWQAAPSLRNTTGRILWT